MDLAKTISLLHRKMNKGLNTRLMQIGLSNAQSGLLELLYYNGKMTQADLCEELKLDKSTVAKALDRMEQNGLVTKTVNPDDSRSFSFSYAKSHRNNPNGTRGSFKLVRRCYIGHDKKRKRALFKAHQASSGAGGNDCNKLKLPCIMAIHVSSGSIVVYDKKQR